MIDIFTINKSKWQGLSDKWPDLRWPLKIVCYSLDPENSTKSCKSRGSNLHVKNTHENAQGMHIWKATSLKDVPLWKLSVSSIVTMVELVGVPKPNGGAGCRVSGPKRVLDFCCTCLKMQSIDDLMGLDVDSLLIEDIQVNKVSKMHCWTYRSTWAPSATLRWFLLKKMQIIPKPEEVAQKKKVISKETNFYINLFILIGA